MVNTKYRWIVKANNCLENTITAKTNFCIPAMSGTVA